MANTGFLSGNSILLHELPEKERTGSFKYEVVDGHHRLTAMRELEKESPGKFTKVPAQILPADTPGDLLKKFGFSRNQAVKHSVEPTLYDDLVMVLWTRDELRRLSRPATRTDIANELKTMGMSEKGVGKVVHYIILARYGDYVSPFFRVGTAINLDLGP